MSGERWGAARPSHRLYLKRGKPRGAGCLCTFNLPPPKNESPSAESERRRHGLFLEGLRP